MQPDGGVWVAYAERGGVWHSQRCISAYGANRWIEIETLLGASEAYVVWVSVA